MEKKPYCISFLQVPPTPEEWLKVAKRFEENWQFPHCLGSLDGKHVVLQAPINSGSEYFNYKRSFSIVLLGLADSQYNFLFAEIGCHGRISDGGVFKNSTLYNILETDENKPPDVPLPGRNLPVPYVIVADSAFELSKRLLKPFPGVPPVGSIKRKFNEQLSRARVVVENTFGILSSVFRVFRQPMLLQPNKAKHVTMTCILLHNFLKNSSTSSQLYMPTNMDEISLRDSHCLIPLRNVSRRPTVTASEIRDEFANYFYNLPSNLDIV